MTKNNKSEKSCSDKIKKIKNNNRQHQNKTAKNKMK